MSSTTTQQAKVCNDCGCAEPVVDFYHGSSTCANCQSQHNRALYQSNAQVAAYYRENNSAYRHEIQTRTTATAEKSGPWNQGENLFLEYNYRNLTAQEIAQKLSRSLSSVTGQIQRIRLRKNISRPCRPQAQRTHIGALAARRYAQRPWDPDDDIYLHKWFHTRDLEHWAALLGRTPAQVKARYKHLSARNTPTATAV